MAQYERTIFVAKGQRDHTGWTDEAGKVWDMPNRIDSILQRLKRSPVPYSLHTVPETQQPPYIAAIHNTDMIYAQERASAFATPTDSQSTSFDVGQEGTSRIYPGTFPLAMRTLRAAELAVASLTQQAHEDAPLSIALSRPPGHHAGRSYYHGFCFVNNAAGAAHLLRQQYEKVAIVDIDVHHGDGTQDIFYEDPAVFYTSLHADLPNPSPSTGSSCETGAGQGYGTTANFPFEIGVRAAKYSQLFTTACERVTQFNPGAVVISAGFDGHKGEFTHLPPITQLEDEHYFAIGQTIGALKLPTCVVLEGGYNLDTLAGATEAFVTGVEQGIGKA